MVIFALGVSLFCCNGGSGRSDGGPDAQPAGDLAFVDGGPLITDGGVNTDAFSDDLTYYISPNRATNPATREFTSIADFNAEGPACFSGRERILFESVHSYVGQLRLQGCGAGAEGSVGISTYGGAERATLTGATSILDLDLSWEKVVAPTFNGKPITYLQGTPLSRAGPIAKAVRQVYYKGQRMTLARAPNPPGAGAQGSHYFSATAFWDYSPDGCQAGACIQGDDAENPTWTLRTFGPGPDSFAVIRTSDWTLQRSEIVYHDPVKNSFAVKDSLKTEDNGYTMPTAGYGFIILNALPLLDQAGEWYWDRDEQYLYFWSPDNMTPTRADTLVNFIPDGPVISADFADAKLGLVVTDLIVERSPDTAIRMIGGRDLTVERVLMIQPETYGVVAWQLSGSARVESCVIQEPVNNGIHLVEVADEIRVAGNQVTDPGGIHNQPTLGMDFNGIRVAVQDRLSIVDNVVERAGYAGVMLAPATTSLEVASNTVNGYCLLLNDCGGIYYNGESSPLKANQVISGNVLTDSLGNMDGTPGAKGPLAAGVYLDQGTSYVEVRDNQVEASHSAVGGVYLHGGNHNDVHDNIVQAVFGPAFAMRKIGPSFPAMDGNAVHGNTFKTSSVGYAVVRLIDPSGNNCAGMSSVIAPDNVLIHLTVPGYLEMCD